MTASDEDEVLKHVLIHKADHHPEKDVSEADIRRMTKQVEVSTAQR